MFRAFGHTNSSVLDGGLLRWEAEGLALEKKSESEVTSSQSEEAEYPIPHYDSEVVKSQSTFLSLYY